MPICIPRRWAFCRSLSVMSIRAALSCTFSMRLLPISFSESWIRSLVRYLNHRAIAIRGHRVTHAASEADLLAFYLQCEDEDGLPYFPDPSQRPETTGFNVIISQGEFNGYVSRPEYRRKKAEQGAVLRLGPPYSRVYGSYYRGNVSRDCWRVAGCQES
jgi:hypothetical protein